jgi:hypothetical protein
LLVWTGQFRAQMWCSILQGALLPVGFLLAVDYGLVGIAATWAVLYPLTNLPPIYIGLKTVSVSFLRWLDTAKPAAVACLVMALAVLGTRAATAGQADAVRLAAAVGTGAAVYAAVLWLVYRARIMVLVDFVRKGVARPAVDPSAPAAV